MTGWGLYSTAVEGKGGAGLVEAKYVARFLKTAPGLGKVQIGEFLSKGPPEKYPFHSTVLQEYVDTFDFSGERAVQTKCDRVIRGMVELSYGLIR